MNNYFAQIRLNFPCLFIFNYIAKEYMIFPFPRNLESGPRMLKLVSNNIVNTKIGLYLRNAKPKLQIFP